MENGAGGSPEQLKSPLNNKQDCHTTNTNWKSLEVAWL